MPGSGMRRRNTGCRAALRSSTCLVPACNADGGYVSDAPRRKMCGWRRDIRKIAAERSLAQAQECLIFAFFFRRVAQPGSAPLWGSGGRRFKSGRADNRAEFASSHVRVFCFKQKKEETYAVSSFQVESGDEVALRWHATYKINCTALLSGIFCSSGPACAVLCRHPAHGCAVTRQGWDIRNLSGFVLHSLQKPHQK